MTMTTGDDDGSCPRRAGSSPTSTAAQDRADNGKPAPEILKKCQYKVMHFVQLVTACLWRNKDACTYKIAQAKCSHSQL